MTLRVDTAFDVTQRELIVDIAACIYKTHDADIRGKDTNYLFESQHPTERACLMAAEDIYEIFFGDTPDYSDEEEITEE